VLEAVCADPARPAFQCAAATLRVTLPGTGELATLTSRPGLELRTPGTVPVAADGNLWVTGRLPGTDRFSGAGRLGAAASADGGRTWSVVELPEPPGPNITRVDISVSGDTLYAIEIGDLPATVDGLIAIFRSDDGGRNWRQTWQSDGVREPRAAVGAVVATTDGRLLVNSAPDGMFVSTDGGASFVPMGQAGVARWTRVGYVVAPTGPSPLFMLSWNGVDWREIAISPS
jgi:photosystem II stability/assembly factor-like uncharacterized protein